MTWNDVADDMGAGLDRTRAALDRGDWTMLAALQWAPTIPAPPGRPDPATASRLGGLLAEIEDLRRRVAEELAAVEDQVAALSRRRRAGRAYTESLPAGGAA